ncbi:MAG: hypothetical protein JW841_12630 [Deltaproteobacteria bacterium]|nr:hypothetical protein [Deltaproteobacteria bacterium]
MNHNFDIHFAFPDETLVYNCQLCDQRCCKTGFIQVFSHERERLLSIAPALELVAPAITNPIGLFASPPSGCWFLKNNLCTLTTSHGGALRPSACTLFPINRFAAHGNTLIIAPDPLCPMQCHPSEGISFTEVVELLNKLGVAGANPTPVRVNDPPDSLALERMLRDAASSVIDEPSPIPYLALGELATHTFCQGGLEELTFIDLKNVDASVTALQHRLAQQAIILSIPIPNPAAWSITAPLLISYIPSLRLFDFEKIPLAVLARAISTLALLVAHWCNLRPLQKPLPQTLNQMANTMGPLCYLMASWDEPWNGPQIQDLDLCPQDPISHVEAKLEKRPIERLKQLWMLARLLNT